jgi:hypothetical protein
MTLDSKKLEGFDLRDAKFLEIIDKNGWHVMSVAPRVGEHGAIFSYSTGLFLPFKHPEIILCGLEPDSSIRIINEIGRQVQPGKTFEVSQPYSDIFADDVNKCQFRPVQVALYGEYACWTQWFYEGNDFPLFQCFGLTRKGTFLGKKTASPPLRTVNLCSIFSRQPYCELAGSPVVREGGP